MPSDVTRSESEQAEQASRWPALAIGILLTLATAGILEYLEPRFYVEHVRWVFAVVVSNLGVALWFLVPLGFAAVVYTLKREETP